MPTTPTSPADLHEANERRLVAKARTLGCSVAFVKHLELIERRLEALERRADAGWLDQTSPDARLLEVTG